MIIAIDGPAAAGKGTTTGIIAKKLNLITIDTGATYRAVAVATLNNGLTLNDKDKIIELTKKIEITFDDENHVFLDGDDITSMIRSKEVTKIVSPLSSIEEVREQMVNLQRKLAEGKNVIMEGRDITTVVFPNADYKFYLDASVDERVKRRYKQNREQNIDMSYDEILENIKARDKNDMSKKVGALIRTNDQIYIDTTNMSVDEVVEKILSYVERGNE